MSLGDAEEMEITTAAFKVWGSSFRPGQREHIMIHYDRIAVIGAGLIGSSLLRAIAAGAGWGNAYL